MIYEFCLASQVLRQQGSVKHRDSEHNQGSVDSMHRKRSEESAGHLTLRVDESINGCVKRCSPFVRFQLNLVSCAGTRQRCGRWVMTKCGLRKVLQALGLFNNHMSAVQTWEGWRAM